MSDKNQKNKPECPVPKEVRDAIKETADIVDKHKQVIRKFNPLG
jgi:hypothetical protein